MPLAAGPAPPSGAIVGPPSGGDESLIDLTSGMFESELNPSLERARSLVGSIISGRYRIHELIAMGGMGAVYRGEHIHLRKRLAVKVLHPETENLPELVERFRREALVGAHARHPHVAAATDFGTLDDGSYFLALEHVRGVTLYDALRHGPMPPARAVHIARQIADALGALHARGIIHRDVKPQNVMLVNPTSGGPAATGDSAPPPASRGPDFIKLIDFGLSTVELDRLPSLEMSAAATPLPVERLTLTGTIFGTVAYLAPEATLGMDNVDGRGDLYALGVVLYEMLAGRRPFLGETPADLIAQHVSAPPPPFREAAPGRSIPAALERVALKLLAKDPAARYQRGADVVAALDAALAAGDEPAPPAFPPPPPPARVSVSDTIVTPSPFDDALRSTTFMDSDLSINRAPAPPPPAARSLPSPHPLAYLAALLLPVLAAALYLLLSRPDGPPPEPPASTAPDGRAGPAPTTGAAAPPDATAAPAASASAGASAAELEQLRAQVRLVANKTNDYEAGRKALVALVALDPPSLAQPNFARAAADVVAGVEDAGKPGSDELFALLASERSAPHGPDLLYDVVQFRGGRRAARRAADLLRTPEVMNLASPALRVTFAFREADCPRKESLAERAVADGDGRTLLLLKLALGGCGRTPTLEKAYNDLLLRLIKK